MAKHTADIKALVNPEQKTPGFKGYEFGDNGLPTPVEYHNIEQFLDLSIEELFLEPLEVYPDSVINIDLQFKK